jgi:glycogen operon protein
MDDTKPPIKVWPGKPAPLGAFYDGTGTNFSLFSETAKKVELCLFDEEGHETRIELPEVTGHCWHGYFPTIEPGQRYGYRVTDGWAPEKGQRTNPAKLLLDPYAKAIDGEIKWNDALFSYKLGVEPLTKSEVDSAPFLPKCVVTQPFFDWSGDRNLSIPWHDTIIYETHVKGFTAKNPAIPEEIRGTYAGLAHPASIEYFKSLGCTAVELMPVHYFVHERHLIDKGLKNYWGYNSIGFFAPHSEYASDKRPGASVGEFKRMVKAFHEAGLEVILDVVYNHTGEGNHHGPMLSLKGIDNAYYYRLAKDPLYFQDYTGTGNSLQMKNPHVLQLIMDSLRYWVQEMHVDGFRFDLAATLARQLHDVDRLSAFFDLIQQDPIINQVKLIAEPWDVGEGGYQVGNFPAVWTEWNGKYRDCARDFWRGERQTLAEFATRFTGSSDIYANTTRRPYASINFITCHDGFTMHDLVSYNGKHNEANGEENRDGENNNRSWNCGAEGPTDDPVVIELRKQQTRNMLVTLFLSQGVTMMLGGDEIGRTQRGNNNAYCQDNELSWFDWEHQDADLLAFTQKLIAYRKSHPVFRRRGWFLGKAIYGSEVRDIGWFTPDGEQMKEQDWKVGFAKSIGIFLNGKTIPNPFTTADPVFDDNFYVIFNSHHEPLEFTLPPSKWGTSWIKDLCSHEGWFEQGPTFKDGDKIQVLARSSVVLRHAS